MGLCRDVYAHKTRTHGHTHADTIHARGHMSHHCYVEGVEEVKGQGRDEINKEPGVAVVEVDGVGIVHHLARLAHVGGPKIQYDI